MELFFLLDFLILGARMLQKIVVAYLVNNQLNNKLASPIAEFRVVIEITRSTEELSTSHPMADLDVKSDTKTSLPPSEN